MVKLTKNRIKILETLATAGARSRDTIAKYTNIPRTTVYDNLVVLRRYGYVTTYHKKTDKHGPGCPKTMYEISI